MSENNAAETEKILETEPDAELDIELDDVEPEPDFEQIDRDMVFFNVVEAYLDAKKKRNNYKKYGPLTVVITGILFLTLMFTLDNKILFLILWVAIDLYMVALMVRAEYKLHKFRTILGLEKDEEEEIEEEIEDTEEEEE